MLAIRSLFVQYYILIFARSDDGSNVKENVRKGRHMYTHTSAHTHVRTPARTNARTHAHLRTKRAGVGSTVQVKEKEQRASGGLDGEGRATESGEETRGRESTTAKQEERDGETDR